MTINELKLIGASEVCKMCDFSNQYLQNLVLRKKIPYKKVSGRFIFLLNDIVEFQKEREIKAVKDNRIKIKKNR